MNEDTTLLISPEEGLCLIDTRDHKLKCITEDPITSFDINGSIYWLESDKLTYYGLDFRNANQKIWLNSEIDIDGELGLKFYDREPYSYIKADLRRMGLMSNSSLIFNNHGEFNQTSKLRFLNSVVGKEVVNYSNRPTNSIDYDRNSLKYSSSALKLTDFDYFDRFYCVSTINSIVDEAIPNYVELFEVKS